MVLAAFALSAVALPSGATDLVQQVDPSSDVIGTEVVLQAGLDRQTAAQNGLASLVAETILQTPENGMPLKDAVAANGGSISYTMDPGDVRFYVEGLTGSYGTVLGMFASALAKPDFSDKTLMNARTALIGRINENQRLALDVGVEMLNASFYQNSSAGMPPDGLPQTVASFAPADARAFYAAHYKRDDAIISTVGNSQAVGADRYSALVSGLAPGTSPAVPAGNPPRVSETTHQLIARRDVPVPWLVAQYPAPNLSSADFGAMLVLTEFMQRTLADVSGVPGLTTQSDAERGVGAFYNFDTSPANVVIYVDGGLGDPTRTFATALTVVNVLGHAKLSGDLNQMKAFAAGRFLEDTTSLADRAWLGGVFASFSPSGDYHDRVVKAIKATTAADIQRVAARYLNAPTIALVLPREQQAGTSSP